MMKAWEFGMTDGDFVFYTIAMLPEENVLNPEDVWSSDDGQDEIAKKAFDAVFHVRIHYTEWAKKVNPKCSTHNFVKYWPILKILSPLQSPENLQCSGH